MLGVLRVRLPVTAGVLALLACASTAQGFVQQGARLKATEAGAGGHLGFSVALSADGNTALVGADTDNTLRGAAFVFTRSGGTWTQQGGELVPSEEVGNGLFGWSVALSADGDTALIGGNKDNGEVGAAWVFTRSGSTWTQQGQKLVPQAGQETGKGEFGEGLALSADGNTAIIGAGADNSFHGAAWVFTRSGSTWTQQGGKLTGGEESGGGELGWSAALSGDGNTALAGGTGDNTNKGAAWVFTRSGGAWSQQGGKLTGKEEEGSATELGYSAALSFDGNTALVGGPFDNSEKGAAWVFTRAGSSWTQAGSKLTPVDEVGKGHFGWSVAIAPGAEIAAIGGPFDSSGAGAAWEFGVGAPGGLELNKLVPSEETSGSVGMSVALSADGATMLAGAPFDGLGAGDVFAFVEPPRTPTTGPPANVERTSATLTGADGGGPSHTSYFQYGTTTAYGSSTPAQELSFDPFIAIAPQAPGTFGFTAAIAGLTPGTIYHYRLVSEDSGGARFGADQTFTTYGTPVCVCAPFGGSRLTVTNARQNHARWREGARAAKFSRHGGLPTGTTFSFGLNEAATVTFAFTQRVAGRSVTGRCVAPSPRNRHKHRCARTITRATLAFAAHAGTDKLYFAGLLHRGKRLAPGPYTVRISARGDGRVSNTVALSFTIAG